VDPRTSNTIITGTYLPFGAGRRICVGATFALTEGTLIAAMLVQRFRLELDAETQIVPSATVTLRPRGGLPMLVTARRRRFPPPIFSGTDDRGGG
jgi:cytochrome P450